MNYIFEAEGKTKAEAEQLALGALDLKADDVTFETVESGKGFLGLVNRKPALVRMFPKNVPINKIIQGTVLTIIRKMGLQAEAVTVEIEEDGFVVSIDSDDSAILIGKQGRTLDSLQFLVNCMVESRLRENRRVILDVAAYRERRRQRLTKLAKAVADRVARTGQSVLLEWMNPYERRIVHLALEPDERVTTRSDGNGVYKRVRVLPQKGAGRDRGGRGNGGGYRQDRNDRGRGPDRGNSGDSGNTERENHGNRVIEESQEDRDFNRRENFPENEED